MVKANIAALNAVRHMHAKAWKLMRNGARSDLAKGMEHEVDIMYDAYMPAESTVNNYISDVDMVFTGVTGDC